MILRLWRKSIMLQMSRKFNRYIFSFLSLFSTRRKVRAKRYFFAATLARRIFFIFHTKSVRAKMFSENK